MEVGSLGKSTCGETLRGGGMHFASKCVSVICKPKYCRVSTGEAFGGGEKPLLIAHRPSFKPENGHTVLTQPLGLFLFSPLFTQWGSRPTLLMAYALIRGRAGQTRCITPKPAVNTFGCLHLKCWHVFRRC